MFLSFIHLPVHLGSRTQPWSPLSGLLCLRFCSFPFWLLLVTDRLWAHFLDLSHALLSWKTSQPCIITCSYKKVCIRHGSVPSDLCTQGVETGGLWVGGQSLGYLLRLCHKQTTYQTKEGAGRLLSGQMTSPNKHRQKVRRSSVHPGSMEPRTVCWNLRIHELK